MLMDPPLMDAMCNCYALRRATRRVTQLYDHMLAPIDLRATQLTLLREIDRRGPIALNPLAAAMVMDRTTLGHNLRPLQDRGLVRLVAGKDRRSREVSLTGKGRTTLARGWKLWRRAQDAFEARLGPETAAALRRLLHRVAGTEFLPAETGC
jgi:DNA-binding MarR family transcriptional regulator